MGNNVAVSHGSCMLCPVCACAQVLEVRHLLSQDTRVSNHQFFSLRKDIAEHHRKDAQPPVPIHKAGRDHEAHRQTLGHDDFPIQSWPVYVRISS